MNPPPRRLVRSLYLAPIIALLPLMLWGVKPAAAACDPPGQATPGAAPLTLVTSEPIDGTTRLRIAGVDVPSNPEWELPASALIADVLRAGCLRLEPEPSGLDRYGRLPVQAWAGGTWMQGALLDAGLARVRPSPDERLRIPEMLATEGRARDAATGLWHDPTFAVRRASDPATVGVGFQIVEGSVLSAERRQDQWYLNFGPDWRSDFTATIPKSALPEFARAGLEPFSLQGRPVRVRGWVQTTNGPMIEILIPEQIEILGPAETQTRAQP